MIVRHEGQAEICCDGEGCKAVRPVVPEADLKEAIEDAKALGWRWFKDGNGFQNACPACVRRWWQAGARRNANPDEKQGNLL